MGCLSIADVGAGRDCCATRGGADIARADLKEMVCTLFGVHLEQAAVRPLAGANGLSTDRRLEDAE